MRKVFCFIQCAFLALCTHTMESVQSLSESKYQEAMDDLSKKIELAKGVSNLSETEIDALVKSLITGSDIYNYCIKYKKEIETKFKGINRIDEETWEREIGPVMERLGLLFGFVETFCDYTDWCDDELMGLYGGYEELRGRLGDLKRGCYRYIKDLENKGFTTPSEEEGYVLIDISYHRLVEYALRNLSNIKNQELKNEITEWISYSSEEFKQHVIPEDAEDRTKFFRIASLDKKNAKYDKDDKLEGFYLIQDVRNEQPECREIIVEPDNEVTDDDLIELLKAIIENPVGEARIRSLILLSKLQKAGLFDSNLFMNNKKEISDYVWVYGNEGDGGRSGSSMTLRENTLVLGINNFSFFGEKGPSEVAPSHIHELSHAYHAALGIAGHSFPTEEYKKFYQSDSDPALQYILKDLSHFKTKWEATDEPLTIMGVGIYSESDRYYKIIDSINENSARFCLMQKASHGYRINHNSSFKNDDGNLNAYYATNWNNESKKLDEAKRKLDEVKSTKDQIGDATKK